MLNRGQHRLRAGLWAVLGICLGTVGYQTAMGGPPGTTGDLNSQGTPSASALAPPTAPTLMRGAYPDGTITVPVPETGPVPGMAPTPGMPMVPGTMPPGAMPPGAMPPGDHGPGETGPLPVELTPSSHPPYTVAPPDILYIDSMRLIPRPPYRLDALDQLQIIVSGTLNNQPISGIYTVQPDGTLNLGFSYGSVRVVGLTLDQAQAEIRRHLGSSLRDPQVAMTLLAFRGVQQTRGEHLVRQDGTIALGTYGSLYVAGLTLGQIKCLVENHLSKWFLNPQVSVDIAAYNSKFYYVIADGGGFGQSVFKFPVTGNEYVLDAIANIQGLPPIASKRRIWVSRPNPCGVGCYQILPVDWRAITEGANTCTNYQLFPGDRVFIAADRLIAIDNWLSKIYAPIERTFGLLLLNNYMIQSFRLLSAPITNSVGIVGIGR